jgi:hypothetical protein
LKKVTISGRGKGLKSFTADGRAVASLVVPSDIRNTSVWLIRLGAGGDPYLVQSNCALRSAIYLREKGELHLRVSSFNTHSLNVRIWAPFPPSKVTVDGQVLRHFSVEDRPEGGCEVILQFAGSDTTQDIRVKF